MPKQVDPQQRRELIAEALLELAARQGLQAVSLRQVASEAGVTAGMVQHYFSSKDEMMRFAMREASSRYEARMNEAFAALGKYPSPRETLRTLLTALLPLNDSERDDARVALAFQAYAATDANASQDLSQGDNGMRSFIAEQLRAAWAQEGGEFQGDGATRYSGDPECVAAALLGAAEGLGMHILSTTLPAESARAALEALLATFLDRSSPVEWCSGV